ncbi:hypothetical protein [Achromobacter sp. MYb9]|uniref:hypothetical protein n=1 Tax=Achromobacter sp. MYb9 TaxID=1827284 RepID=UPI0011B1CE4D|nr:hypothetical protein [Achromobacter sp. MYb9]
MATLLRLPCYAAYAFAALLGYLTYHLFERPFMVVSSAFSRTPLGRQTFILASHSPLGLRHMFWILLIAFLGIEFISLSAKAVFDPLWLLLAVLLVLLVFSYSGRVLTVANSGGRRWNVHLNVLRTRRQSSAVQWRGAFADLDSIAHMARAGRLNTLKLESTLLVSDATAQRLKRKLERIFSKHGLVANVVINKPRALGIVGSGFIHVLLARQRQLKAHRIVHHAPLDLMTRMIEVELSQAPRSLRGTEVAD